MRTIRIAVGSVNPAKIEAARLGALLMLGSVEVVGVAVASGVRDQPHGDAEMVAGAEQRCLAALRAVPDAELGIGLEGGVVEHGGRLFACAWCAIADGGSPVSLACSGRFELPPAVARLVKCGVELGEADDIVFGRRNSKQQEGAVGILTHGRITRAHFYANVVSLALLRRLNPELYAGAGLESR